MTGETKQPVAPRACAGLDRRGILRVPHDMQCLAEDNGQLMDEAHSIKGLDKRYHNLSSNYRAVERITDPGVGSVQDVT